MSNSMICSVCDQHKNEVKRRKSKLLPGMQYLSCDTCTAERKEPRYIVIMAGRTHGLDHVAKVISKRLYNGKEITAQDLVV